MSVTTGSEFTGYGGLDLAVEAALGARTIWCSDVDPGACRVIAHRFPDAPNLGDICSIDWSRVARPTVITGGFPCTDLSNAGKQDGLIRYGEGKTRSGLWAEMCRSIDELRPALVIAENVRAITSVKADSNLEPCPWCVGDEPGEHVLRALGAVLGDLADIGYDARWTGIRAAAVGAPHGRFRIFIAAADARSGGFDRGAYRLGAGEPAGLGFGQPADDAAQAVADPRSLSRGQSRGAGCRAAESGRPCGECAGCGRVSAGDGGQALSDASGQPWSSRDGDGRSAAADADRAGLEGSESARRRHLPDGRSVPDSPGVGWGEGRPESARLVGGSDAAFGCSAVPESVRGGFDGGSHFPLGFPYRRAAAAGVGCEPWCQRDRNWVAPNGDDYGPAIRRWHDLTRCVPDPAVPSPRSGSLQLSPMFDEWLMGVPLGWVSDVDIWRGMKPSKARNAVLKLCGNGVVPQQGYAALQHLLAGTGWLVNGR